MVEIEKKTGKHFKFFEICFENPTPRFVNHRVTILAFSKVRNGQNLQFNLEQCLRHCPKLNIRYAFIAL